MPIPLATRPNQEGLPVPILGNLPPVLAARYTWALESARMGLADVEISEAIGGQEGADTVQALGEWLARERLRGQVDLAKLLHLAAVRDSKALIFAVKHRLKWTDELPPLPPVAPPSVVINIPGLTMQDPTQ